MFSSRLDTNEKVFALENEADIRRHYTNGLKQALYLQLGSSRAGMTLAKDKQTRLWRALKASECNVDTSMIIMARVGCILSRTRIPNLAVLAILG